MNRKETRGLARQTWNPEFSVCPDCPDSDSPGWIPRITNWGWTVTSFFHFKQHRVIGKVMADRREKCWSETLLSWPSEAVGRSEWVEDKTEEDLSSCVWSWSQLLHASTGFSLFCFNYLRHWNIGKEIERERESRSVVCCPNTSTALTRTGQVQEVRFRSWEFNKLFLHLVVEPSPAVFLVAPWLEPEPEAELV